MPEKALEAELSQEEYEKVVLAKEAAMDAEMKEMRKQLALLTAEPAVAPKAVGVSINATHIGYIVGLFAIITAVWQFAGAPLTSLRDDVRDIKSNYVSNKDLNAAIANLVSKPNFDGVAARVETLAQDVATIKNQNQTSINDRARLADQVRIHDASLSAMQERMARMEAKQK